MAGAFGQPRALGPMEILSFDDIWLHLDELNFSFFPSLISKRLVPCDPSASNSDSPFLVLYTGFAPCLDSPFSPLSGAMGLYYLVVSPLIPL